MCNSYRIGPDRRGPARSAIADILRDWDAPRLIRPTNTAPVLLPDGPARLMRWGFHRPGLKFPLNNTRTDNLGHHFWKKAWRTRQRCLIPALGYYEYTGPAGNKQAHLFHSPDTSDPGEQGPYLWCAGIWEENPDPAIGPSYSMLMTAAVGDLVTRIHDRMPVLLTPGDFHTYMAAETAADLLFPPVDLAVADVPNPLKRKPSAATPERPPPSPAELF